MADTAQIQIRPPYAEKFRPAAAKALITQVLTERLADKTYNPESTAQLTREIADEIKRCHARSPDAAACPPPRPHRTPAADAQPPTHTHRHAPPPRSKLKSELELPRYKFVVQVVIGEDRGACVRMGCRCFWDAETDNYAEDTYRNVRRRAPRSATARQPDTAAICRRPPAPRAQDSLFCVAAAYGAYLY